MKSLTLLLSLILFSISFTANAQDPYYFEFSKTIVFPNGQSNMVSYIAIPNTLIGGNLTISITGGYNYQLNKGVLSKRITIVDNGSGQFSSTSSEVLYANGELARQWNIGDFDSATRRIPIYHLLNTGNDLNIRIEGQLINSVAITTIKNAISISAPVALVNTKTRQYKSMMDDRIGIGTLDPRERLSVNGNIRAHEIKVETANWPDYVFKPDYQMRSLDELKTFIDNYHHLPEIPSEDDVAKNGIALGEMNKLLLKKVEELTLYLIEKDKKEKNLEARLQHLEIGLPQRKKKSH